ncbi:MAG: putative nad-dependent epimerase/dehydratase domain protein [Deltaproteobacteria bacterium]|nr:putative nad-dependent epimerase/dehydratase domain protein [Deltaproteobacteria bacterium]
MIGVLGASGFVGSAFTEHFSRTGLPVTRITRETYDSFVGTRFDYLVIAAANSSKRLGETDPLADFDRSVRLVMKAVVDFPAGCVLHLSSIDVYNDTSDPARNAEDAPVELRTLSVYGFHKRLAEGVVLRHARRSVIFRLAGMFGANSTKGPAHDILNGLPIWVSPGSRFLLLDTATVVRAVWALREHSGETFNVAASDNITLSGFSEIVGRPIRQVNAHEMLEYRINVHKASRLVHLPTSREAAAEWRSSMENTPPGKGG